MNEDTYILIGDFESMCGKYGFVFAVLNPTLLGFSPDEATNTANGNVGVDCEFWHYNGIIHKYCNFAYGTDSVSGTDNFVPGLPNVNTTSDWDWNGYNIMYNDPTYINRTCQ